MDKFVVKLKKNSLKMNQWKVGYLYKLIRKLSNETVEQGKIGFAKIFGYIKNQYVL